MKELNKFREFLLENEVHEGTWGYGSKDQMIKALSKLEKIRKMGGVKGSLELDKIGSMLYNTFGSDDFHDSIDAAKDAATDDDRFANYIGDAQIKGLDMLNSIYSGKGGNAFSKAADNPEVRGRDAMSNDLSENDKALDEVIEEGTLSDEINNNMKLIAVHMSAAETLEDIVAEFNIIQGGKEILAQVLRNIVKDNKLTGDPEEYASIGFEE